MVVFSIMANQVNILVVEDNITILEAIVHCIEAPHIKVTKANDGFEALKMLEEMRYEIIITDYHMPNMNGDELIKRAKMLWPCSIIIGMTGDGDATPLYRAGAHICLDKPLWLREIKTLIERIISDILHRDNA
jgi:CheY-like chemotaxis protein